VTWVGFFQNVADAQQSVSVVILPFEVHAKEELTYLQNEIPRVLATYLEQEGAKVLALDNDSVPRWREQIESISEIQNIGRQTGGTHIIWGSMTWIGQQFSLDVKLLDLPDGQKPSLFSVDGKGIENLPASVQKVSDALSLKLFQRVRVTQIVIKGYDRIEEDAIRRVIKIKSGDVFNAKSISEDLKAIYAMGYFDDIRVETETVDDGKTIIFRVKEKPILRRISISGNTKGFDDDEIKEVLTLKAGSILNIFHIKNNAVRIEELYREKNYHNVRVTYQIEPTKKNQADLEFIVEEGPKTLIANIRFEGNHTYSDGKLKGLMTTSEKNILSWFTSAGGLVEQNLDQDVTKIKSFYHNNGFIQARVGEPIVEKKGNDIDITINIDEGPQYSVGNVAVSGDLIVPEPQLMQLIKIRQEEFYNRELLRSDILALTDLYSNEGYANVDIVPSLDQDEENYKVDITFEIAKGNQVYFEEIIIAGNNRTRDKVIRRELRVYEQELFSSKRLKTSLRNLYRLEYFEDIKVNTAAGSGPDKKILKIDVTEKSTGAFQFGAGYGNVENFFGVINITERNLFGRGQRLSAEGKLGAKTQKFTLSFTEPWLFDIPLSATVDAYNWDYAFDSYDKSSLGGNIRFGYPVYNFTRAAVTYELYTANVTNIAEDAAASIRDLEGENVKSSIRGSLRYDSRDSLFNPTVGTNTSGSIEFAGLGGDIGFIKYIAETAWYHKIFFDLVGVFHAKGGYITEGREDLLLPDYEKFYIGGIDTLRGFERDDLSPRDENGDLVGGDKMVIFNFELRYPIVEEAGVVAAAFFDTGDVYGDDERMDLTNLRESAGLGFKWFSPMGPINLYYGWILDPKPTDSASGGWEFSMATSF
jgi:outer membrane protein insertion porin family